MKNIRQNLLMEVMIEEAIKRLTEDPVDGTIEGDLFNTLSEVKVEFWQKNIKLKNVRLTRTVCGTWVKTCGTLLIGFKYHHI